MRMSRKRGDQRALVHETAKELLRGMGIEPEAASGGEALQAVDELYHTQPHHRAYQWWCTATNQEARIFLQEWEQWQARQKTQCAFCRCLLSPSRRGQGFTLYCHDCSAMLGCVSAGA